MNNISNSTKYINQHLNDNDNKVIYWLNKYLHSSWKNGSAKDRVVLGYKYFYDHNKEIHYKAGSIIIYSHLDTFIISLHNFKKYCRRFWYYF